MRVGVVVGNLKPQSRTLDASVSLVKDLIGRPPEVVIDVVTLGPGLLGWGDAAVAAAVLAVGSCDVVIIASPTYKGAYTGILKLFLDQFPSSGLVSVVALPVMLGAGPGHAMAPDLVLKPVLVELGAVCPVKGLYLLESDYRDPGAIAPWLEACRAVVSRPAEGDRR